ncbi:hypothetical protein LOTGIDRAFT_170950 [Lottia gigantea]|uniref:Uncharacterized protein n=1 Tax=Lottia gigantea TaxID=225164 RepID=V4AJA0_LOTGI|nr:hypothetical protein LOTGIDRAFT_170950 [Lottia gigantea]ESP04254.1 hypothetical protein LOTGIDRAFT_170950 [Lottia gigantea]
MVTNIVNNTMSSVNNSSRGEKSDSNPLLWLPSVLVAVSLLSFLGYSFAQFHLKVARKRQAALDYMVIRSQMNRRRTLIPLCNTYNISIRELGSSVRIKGPSASECLKSANSFNSYFTRTDYNRTKADTIETRSLDVPLPKRNYHEPAKTNAFEKQDAAICLSNLTSFSEAEDEFARLRNKRAPRFSLASIHMDESLEKWRKKRRILGSSFSMDEYWLGNKERVHEHNLMEDSFDKSVCSRNFSGLDKSAQNSIKLHIPATQPQPIKEQSEIGDKRKRLVQSKRIIIDRSLDLISVYSKSKKLSTKKYLSNKEPISDDLHWTYITPDSHAESFSQRSGRSSKFVKRKFQKSDKRILSSFDRSDQKSRSYKKSKVLKATKMFRSRQNKIFSAIHKQVVPKADDKFLTTNDTSVSSDPLTTRIPPLEHDNNTSLNKVHNIPSRPVSPHSRNSSDSMIKSEQFPLLLNPNAEGPNWQQRISIAHLANSTRSNTDRSDGSSNSPRYLTVSEQCYGRSCTSETDSESQNSPSNPLLSYEKLLKVNNTTKDASASFRSDGIWFGRANIVNSFGDTERTVVAGDEMGNYELYNTRNDNDFLRKRQHYHNIKSGWPSCNAFQDVQVYVQINQIL